MFLLPTILAALLATTAWAQFNSTAANGTDIPAPFNGAFNTDNATIIYPKAGNYWSYPYSLDWPIIFRRPKGTTDPWIIYLQDKKIHHVYYQYTEYDNAGWQQPSVKYPATNKDWPADQTWCRFFGQDPEAKVGLPGTGYFLSIYLGKRNGSKYNPQPYGQPIAVSEIFELRNIKTIDPNLPKGPNKQGAPTASYSGAMQNRPSSGLLTAVGALACVAVVYGVW